MNFVYVHNRYNIHFGCCGWYTQGKSEHYLKYRDTLSFDIMTFGGHKNCCWENYTIDYHRFTVHDYSFDGHVCKFWIDLSSKLDFLALGLFQITWFVIAICLLQAFLVLLYAILCLVKIPKLRLKPDYFIKIMFRRKVLPFWPFVLQCHACLRGILHLSL